MDRIDRLQKKVQELELQLKKLSDNFDKLNKRVNQPRQLKTNTESVYGNDDMAGMGK
jgi:prefoldin subunit 5